MVAAQNMGHVGLPLSNLLWGSEQALRRDFGPRSAHVVSVAAKAITEAYYGQKPAFSYFRGCSTGGREGLAEAHLHPDDFDGVIAGDPAFPARQGGIANVWDTRQLRKRDGSLVFTPAKLRLINDAVLKACDDLDGAADGIINDPLTCRFDVASLLCPDNSDEPACLNADQLAAAVALYDGPRDSSGVRLVPGYRVFGSELAWEADTRANLADGYLKYLAFEPNPEPGYSIWDFDFTRDIAKLEPMAALYDAVAPYAVPDLTAFEKAGGKLIIYHGFADPTVSPVNTLDYYAELVARQGGLESVRNWARVFMVPGMFHCRGGNAPNSFDLLSAIVAWVERGDAPQRVVATQMAEGRILRTRPLVPYPETARYFGQGDVNDEANWISSRPDILRDDRIAWRWAPK